MKLIVGLGNPGKQYETTRHNVGFMVVDELASSLNVDLTLTKFNGIYASALIEGEKVFLLKPLTYMNLSGDCVVPFMNYFNIQEDELVVIYDDLDLPVGKIRLRKKGSAGGHNGMKSIIQHLGSQTFNRIRIGIDRPPLGMRVPDYVLKSFSQDETPMITDSIKKSKEACERWIAKPFSEVMNEFN
ncbi:aminoacyl-tRNA hydrolase [Bacillus carboniphilus]|uniref:Peptidyl-tRNA hydrolase n=1 Tax=Bacillus carboniphilus TaxID=86663 RepID=A0ABY9JU24_9BACI|nr:aminoacyl-tRNA hydrolase [Bacillus carboniphilus]WLR41927.1 aminoacyl-tRNA hydrolase [Bacillus carboniphilus]